MNDNPEQELEKCKADNKAKSEFISMVTHQLRTPLSGLKWTFKMMLEGELGTFTETQHDIIKKGSESAERMIKLLQEIIVANQNDEWDFQYTFTKADLIRVIENIIGEFLEEARIHNVTIHFEHPQDEFPLIEMDPEKMMLVFQNLLENAIKYSEAGKSVTLRTYLEEHTAIVEIEDEGIGIPENQKDNVFTKFFRADNAKVIKKEGTGLGLFTAQKIVERHNGTISFTSTENKGTTFILRIPLSQ